MIKKVEDVWCRTDFNVGLFRYDISRRRRSLFRDGTLKIIKDLFYYLYYKGHFVGSWLAGDTEGARTVIRTAFFMHEAMTYESKREYDINKDDHEEFEVR